MARYTISYTCGHSGTVNLVGPSRFRENKIAALESSECFDCYKQHSTEAAREQAEEMELPALMGTEKQIAWAETLRIQKLNEVEMQVEKYKEHKAYPQMLAVVEKISNEISAKQWIEWRFDLARQIMDEVFVSMRRAPSQEQLQAEREAQSRAEQLQRVALVEATVRPAIAVSEMAAEIKVIDDVVCVISPEKRDDLIEIVRSMGYSWSDGQWSRFISKLAGNPHDRAVEIGCVLLSQGFPIRCFDELLRYRMVSGGFEPEQTRWIVKVVRGEYAGWFALQWGRNEDYYAVARQLKNSKYSRPYVVVPAAQFAQVLDFAKMHNFKLTKGAQETASQAKEDKEKTLVVSKKPVGKREKSVASVVPPVLVVPLSVDVAGELRDE